MRNAFTPGAQRALAAASAWANCIESEELGLPEVLLGLLDEPECRAALILARHHIHPEEVRQRYNLQAVQSAPPSSLPQRNASTAWSECLIAAESLLVEYPRPLELATEHLLLGIVATDNEVSRWLAERGLLAAELEAEVHRLSGHQPGPLPLDPDFADPLPLDSLQIDSSQLILEPSPHLTSAASRQDSPAQLPSDQLAAMRILDAAANRASEGLRVLEDYLRFQLDDRHLTSLCKNIRHDLTSTLRVYSTAARHAARETRRDVGTQIDAEAEHQRSDLGEVLAANFKRVEQALRSLEEFSKTVSPETAARLEQLRYRTYTLERVVDIARGSGQRLATARLYVLIDGGETEDAFAMLATSLVQAGVSVLQLRDKNLPDRIMLERARRLRAITAGTSTLFIINDRPDLAVLSEADGVHVGQEELSVKDARRILGTRGLIGVSTHSVEQARIAVLEGADYIGVGPTFPSGTKQFFEFTGTALLRAIAEETRLPAFAIGGINEENLSEVLDAGFQRIAVSGAITQAADPAATAKRLLERLAEVEPPAWN